MFNDGFFPTPQGVAERMVEGLTLTHKSILDPSAGKGDLLQFIYDHKISRYSRSPLYAIEINPELRAILTDKGFKVIGTDFLAYPGLQYFDFILMNPPFDEGARHLLKAWDIANGATIRCLLNSETLKNPYTNERKQLVEIIKQHGRAEELGPVFKNAERKTDIDVVLVHLEDNRKKETFRLDFNPEVMAADFDLEDIIDNELALGNIFENYEARFRGAVEAFKAMILARQKVEHYLTPLIRDYPSPQKLIGEALAEGKTADVSYHAFLESTTRAAWDHLFSKTKLSAVTTEGVRREIQTMQNQQGLMAFTADNMEELFHTLFLNRENVMLQCVLEVFDELTKYHKDNREYYEGWKTNAAYKVGKRFILPSIGSWYSAHIDYDASRRIADIEKALCFLSGKRFENILSISSVYGRDCYFGKPMTSEFFRTKLFKKRTMHFQWLDEDLRNEFNAVVARERWGELPEKTKSGAYK